MSRKKSAPAGADQPGRDARKGHQMIEINHSTFEEDLSEARARERAKRAALIDLRDAMADEAGPARRRARDIVGGAVRRCAEGTRADKRRGLVR